MKNLKISTQGELNDRKRFNRRIVSIINLTRTAYTEDCAYAFNDICCVVRKYLKNKEDSK